MFIDRLLDVAILGSLLGLTLTQLPKQILEKAPLLIPGGIAITACSIAGLLVLPLASKLIRWFAALPAIKQKLSPKLATDERSKTSLLSLALARNHSRILKPILQSPS